MFVSDTEYFFHMNGLYEMIRRLSKIEETVSISSDP